MRKLTLQSTCLVTEDGPHDVIARPGARNMYGCLPCPRCGAGYRAAFKRKGVWKILCDECGHEQKAVLGNGYAG